MATTVATMEARLSANTRDFDRDMGRADSRMGRIGASLARNAARAGIAIGVGLGVGAYKSIQAASDLNEQINKTNVVFRGSEKQIIKWSQGLSRSFGLSQRAALESAGTFGNMLVPMGLSREAAADMSMQMVELAGDMASFNNVDPTEALDALRSGIAGETEPLRRLGVDLRVAALEQFRLKQGIEETVAEMSAGERQQLIYEKIMHDSADAQGDFARTADSLPNLLRTLRAEVENLAAKLGQRLLPLATGAVSALSDLVSFIDKVAKAKSPTIALRIVWENVREAASDLWKGLGRFLFGGTTRTALKLDGGKILEWDERTHQGLVDAIAEGIAAVDWGEVSKQMAIGMIDATEDASIALYEWARQNVSVKNFVRLIGLEPDHDYGPDFKDWINSQLPNLQKLFKPNWNNLITFLRNEWRQFSGDVGRIWGRIKGPFVAVSNFIRDHWRTILAVMTLGLSETVIRSIESFNKIRDRAVAVFNHVRNFGRIVWGAITGFIQDVVDKVKELGQTIRNMVSRVTDPLRSVAGFFGDIAGAVGGAVGAVRGGGDFGMSLLAGGSGIVGLGRQLQSMGFSVGEHPAFGGVAPVHTQGSYHYQGRALDINADSHPWGEARALDWLYARLLPLYNSGVIKELLWRTAGHFDHLHLAMAQGGIVTKPTRALIGEAGPEAVIPLRRGGVGNTYNFNGPILDGEKLLRFIREADNRFGMNNGRPAFGV